MQKERLIESARHGLRLTKELVKKNKELVKKNSDAVLVSLSTGMAVSSLLIQTVDNRFNLPGALMSATVIGMNIVMMPLIELKSKGSRDIRQQSHGEKNP